MEKKACCIVSISPVRGEARDASEMVTQLMFGELIRVVEINEPWCKIATETDAYEGYIDIKHIEFLSDKEARRWSDGLSYLAEREITITSNKQRQFICRGAFIPENESSFSIGKNEYSITDFPTTTFKSVLDLAKDYINTPYLWGGKTPFGIDASGFTQMVYKLNGYELLRTPEQQCSQGVALSFIEESEAGDLAFFDDHEGKIIHVGIIMEDNYIIHVNGKVRIDRIDHSGIYNVDQQSHTHKLRVIKKII